MNRGRVTGGFTLIEVLVALVILSTGIIAVLRAFETSVIALGEARDHAWATLLIGNRLSAAEAYIQEHPGQLPPSESGWFQGSHSDFRWQTTISDASRLPAFFGAGCADNGLSLVSVRVWRDGSRKIHRGQTFLRPLPSVEPGQ